MLTLPLEVFPDPATIALDEAFPDAITTSPDHGLREMLTPAAIALPAAEIPAAELPDYEPTRADLAAAEQWDDEKINDRIISRLHLCAKEATRRVRATLRACVAPAELTARHCNGDHEIGRAA